MQNRSTSYLWAIAGAYLIYLGIKQVIALFDGTASVPVLNGVSALLFIVVGGAVLLREWRNYRRSSQPAPEEEAEAAEDEVEV